MHWISAASGQTFHWVAYLPPLSDYCSCAHQWSSCTVRLEVPGFRLHCYVRSQSLIVQHRTGVFSLSVHWRHEERNVSFSVTPFICINQEQCYTYIKEKKIYNNLLDFTEVFMAFCFTLTTKPDLLSNIMSLQKKTVNSSQLPGCLACLQPTHFAHIYMCCSYVKAFVCRF